jgi:hypothetical protein
MSSGLASSFGIWHSIKTGPALWACALLIASANSPAASQVRQCQLVPLRRRGRRQARWPTRTSLPSRGHSEVRLANLAPQCV